MLLTELTVGEVRSRSTCDKKETDKPELLASCLRVKPLALRKECIFCPTMKLPEEIWLTKFQYTVIILVVSILSTLDT